MKKRDFHHFEQTVVIKASTKAASNLGRDKQLSAITSPNLCAKASLISLIMNNGGGNRGACLCKFPGAVISFMLNGQNSGAASQNNLPPSLFPLSTLLLHFLLRIFSSMPPFSFPFFSSRCPLSPHFDKSVHQTVRSGTVLISPPAFKPFSVEQQISPGTARGPDFYFLLHCSLLASCSSIGSSCFLCLSFAFLLFHCLPCSPALAPPQSVCLHLFPHFFSSLLCHYYPFLLRSSQFTKHMRFRAKYSLRTL